GAAVQAYSRPAISVGGSGVHFIELTAGCSHQAHPSLSSSLNYSPHHVRSLIITLLYASSTRKSTPPGVQQNRSLRRYSLSSADETQALACGCFDIDPSFIYAHCPGQTGPDGPFPGGQLRLLGEDDRIHIADCQMPFPQQFHDLTQQYKAGDPSIARISVGKMLPR